MKKLPFIIRWICSIFGLSPGQLYRNMCGIPLFLSDLLKFRREHAKCDQFGRMTLSPVLGDRYEQPGVAGGHYFHQDYLVARRIFIASPHRHIDVGSRIDGFIAHLGVFREVEVLDIRKLDNCIPRMTFLQCDLTRLPEGLLNACDSLSCLHALEHFGLGRYGDPIEYYGHTKAFVNMTRILKVGGTMYFSVPIGPQRIEFNAHRVFSLRFLLDLIVDSFEIIMFSYVDDNGQLHEDCPLSDESIQNSFGCTYGCGIFELKKLR